MSSGDHFLAKLMLKTRGSNTGTSSAQEIFARRANTNATSGAGLCIIIEERTFCLSLRSLCVPNLRRSFCAEDTLRIGRYLEQTSQCFIFYTHLDLRGLITVTSQSYAIAFVKMVDSYRLQWEAGQRGMYLVA